MAIPNRLDNY